MPNPNHTHILFILDVSGSMDSRYKRLEESMHLMLQQQARKLAGYLTVDVTYFDTTPKEGEFEADPMTVHLSMYAGGGTQLYHSSAILLEAFENRYNAKPDDEKPGHVVVVIVTDGDSSHTGSQQEQKLPANVKRMIEQNSWDFAFVAAENGALNQCKTRMGLPSDCGIVENFDTDEGMARIAERLGEFISGVRSNERGHFS